MKLICLATFEYLFPTEAGCLHLNCLLEIISTKAKIPDCLWKLFGEF